MSRRPDPQSGRAGRPRLGCLGLLAGAVLALAGAIAVGGAMTALAGTPPLRGQLVDIGGGRRIHLVCEGPPGGGPTVLFESGAFGFSADWAAVQRRLTAEGVRSCAYDRAGLGFSDPGPSPRDGLHIAADLEGLLQAAHLPAPYILAGHSMAGLHVHLFAARNRGKVAGLVLVEAATPSSSLQGPMRTFAQRFGELAHLADWGASSGVLKPFAFMGDSIGLKGPAVAEKRWAFAHGPHNHWAADEVSHWMITAKQAADAGPLDPAWPTAVITAGPGGGWKEAQAEPARGAAHGYVDHVQGASHATVLGERFADHIVKGVEFVRAAAADRSRP